MQTTCKLLLFALAGLLPLTAGAETPYRSYDNIQWNNHHWKPNGHPYYLPAMNYLRAAHAYLARPGAEVVRDDERFAIGEMWHAAISDGKDPQWQMPVDSTLHGADRFHKAIELLDQARRDTSHQEDDPWVRDLQQRIVHHIDEATRATVQAYNDALQ